jgi:hypothetical protein
VQSGTVKEAVRQVLRLVGHAPEHGQAVVVLKLQQGRVHSGQAGVDDGGVGRGRSHVQEKVRLLESDLRTKNQSTQGTEGDVGMLVVGSKPHM